MLFKSYNELPNGFNKTWEVDMMKNKKLAVILNIAMLIVTALIIFILFIINPSAFEEKFTLVELILLLLGYTIIIVFHELIHGAIFKLGTKEKLIIRFNLMFASASIPTVYFKKKHYFFVGLAPFIIINLLLIISSIIFIDTSGLFIIYALLALHTGGCVGDFYVSYKLLRSKSDILINDTGTKMTCYVKLND